VIVVDSVSHYWSGAGGVLDLKEDAERKMRNPNGYTAWRDITPIHQRMVDTLVAVNAHIIVTMRSKQDYILVERNGKQVPQKVGMAPVQRDGFEYEFDVMLDMDIENVGRVQKTRCPALVGAALVKPGADLAATLREWLTGAAPEQAAPPVIFSPPAQPQAAPAKPAANGKPAASPPQPEPAPAGPLPDDEVIISEATARDFLTAAAAALDTDPDDVKARLHQLGYNSIPGDRAKRLDAYRRMRDAATQPAAQPDPAQAALITDDPDAQAAALATVRGVLD
jgi:hypothetical protein